MSSFENRANPDTPRHAEYAQPISQNAFDRIRSVKMAE